MAIISDIDYTVSAHAMKFYMAMLEQATLEQVEEIRPVGTVDAEGIPAIETVEVEVSVYRGKLTKLFNSLEISNTYYTPIRRVLIASGSIAIVKRGAGGNPSEVRLYHPPPTAEKISSEGLTARRNLATVCLELEQRIKRLEGWRESQGGIDTKEALRNHENRLRRLEGS